MKRCSKCGEEKPLDAFSLLRGKPHSWCKACNCAAVKARYWANPERGRELNNNQRHAKQAADPEGYRAKAKADYAAHADERRAKARAWAAAHPDKVRESRQASYQRNRETRLLGMARWRAENPEKYMASVHNHRDAHREEINARARAAKRPPEQTAKWRSRRREQNAEYSRLYAAAHPDAGRIYRQSHPEQHCAAQARRRARKRNAPIVERVSKAAIIARDKSTCYLCGLVLQATAITLDHVVPLIRGGSHIADNLRVACRSCNSRKHTKLLSEFTGSEAY